MKKIIIPTLKVLLVLAALSLTLGASCITSGNVIIVTYLGDLVGQTDDNFTAKEVNLTDNSDWKDHKDQLNSVDDLGFACKIKNEESTEATGQIYIWGKQLNSIEDVRSTAIKILDGIVVAPNSTRTITWGESADFLSNFNEAKKIVYDHKDDPFYLYFIVKETPFRIDVTDITLFLSINGKA